MRDDACTRESEMFYAGMNLGEDAGMNTREYAGMNPGVAAGMNAQECAGMDGRADYAGVK